MNMWIDVVHFFTVYRCIESDWNRDDFLRKINSKEIDEKGKSHDNSSHD